MVRDLGCSARAAAAWIAGATARARVHCAHERESRWKRHRRRRTRDDYSAILERLAK
jgi:hypothetical protein